MYKHSIRIYIYICISIVYVYMYIYIYAYTYIRNTITSYHITAPIIYIIKATMILTN